MMSPQGSPQSPIVQRFKYYSAGKTGFEHLTPAEGGQADAHEMFETAD